MDPLSQGVLGACVPQSIARRDTVRAATVIGFLAGMMPDLDIFLASKHDPLLFLEYHRQFTHSLIFIPVGGLIAATIFYWLNKLLKFRSSSSRDSKADDLSFMSYYLYATLGYATHGLLDACTSYGTQLFWPFSDYRVAWNYISIIDPIFTLPILLLVALSFIRRSSMCGRLAVAWSLGYLALGAIQYHRALAVAAVVAAERGHEYVRIDAKPSFANLIVWKLIYESEGKFYVDAARLLATPKLYTGSSIAKLDIARDFSGLPPQSQQAFDIERFRWFSSDYLAVKPDDPASIGDVRYSTVPNEVSPLWFIKLDLAAPDQHVQFLTDRDRGISMQKIWQMIAE